MGVVEESLGVEGEELAGIEAEVVVEVYFGLAFVRYDLKWHADTLMGGGGGVIV